MDDEWVVWASSGEYTVSAPDIALAHVVFVSEHPDDWVNAIVVKDMQPPLIVDPDWKG